MVSDEKSEALQFCAGQFSRHAFLFLFIGLFCILNLKGQGPESGQMITGTVIDGHTKEKLPFATVALRDKPYGTTTNVEGFFTLLNLPEDTVILVVSYVGYASREIRIDPGNMKQPVIIPLEPATYNLDEVVVTGKKYKMIESAKEVSMIKVAPQDLSVLPNFGEVDVFRSLQLLPGVSGTNERSSGLYIRGSTPDQNLVLFDGMTVYNVDHFYGFFSAFNASVIKDIQLFKGGFPPSYGGRSSGIVDITGKSGDIDHLHGSTGINLLSGNASVEIPLRGKGSILLAGRRSLTDFLESRTYRNILDMFEAGSEEDIPREPAGGLITTERTTTTIEPVFYFYDFNGKISFKPSYKDHFSFSLYAGEDYLTESQYLYVTPFLRDKPAKFSRKIDNDKQTIWGNRGASGKWSRQWSPRWFSNFQLAYSEYSSSYFNKNFIQIIQNETDSIQNSTWREGVEENLVKDLTARMDLEWQAGAKSKIDFGAWSTNSDIRYNFLRNIYFINKSDSIRELYPDSTIYNCFTDTILTKTQASWLHAVYFQHEWNVNPKLEILYGMRASYYLFVDRIFLDPRLSFKWNVIPGLTLKGATGKYHQFMNQVINEDVTQGSRDFYLLPDGDRIDIGYSWHYILGGSYEKEGFLFDLEAYHKELSGLNEFSLRFRRRDREPEELFYSGNGYARGVDLLLQKKTGKITGWVSYSLGKVIHHFPELNDGYDFYALHDQRHELKLVNVYSPNPRWDLSATWIYGSGMPYTLPDAQYSLNMLDDSPLHYISVGSKNSERLPPYHRLDLAANLHLMLWKVKMDLGLSFFNLYNRKNVWYKKFDLEELPLITTDVRYLGFLPNISLRMGF